MIPFRQKTPIRRDNASQVKHYKLHADSLKQDFNSRCGYCDSSYTWRTSWFEIDHFVPKKFLKTISESEYSNLVFACRSCNNSKRAKWPTGSETVYITANNEGFMDPCSTAYDQQFSRKKDGTICYKTDVGKWMFHQLKLHKAQHQIIWLIEQIDQQIDELEKLASTVNPTLQPKIQEVLLSLHQKYRQYTKKLAEY